MATKATKFGSKMAALPTRQQAVDKSTAALQSIVDGSKAEYRYIRLENLRYNPQNDYALEDTEADIRELAQDIQRNGLLHNIVVSRHGEGDYLLLSGERRVRAYHLLQREEPNDARWGEIYAQVRKSLQPLEEEIILDAANLQARGGGAAGEARYRKATARFVENLKSYFDISDAEAIALTKEYAGASDSTINRNITIEKNLIAPLKALLDKGHIKKLVALAFAGLTADEQQGIADSYAELLSRGEAGSLEAFGEDAAQAIRENRPVQGAKPKKKPGTAMERQRDSLLKSCERMDKTVDTLTAKAKLIRRIDAEAGDGAGRAARVKDAVEALYEKLGALRESL